MMSIDEISARLEITQTLTDYATAVDSGRFEDLADVFVPSAVIDYRAMGGIVGNLAEVTTWLAEVLPAFSAYCHHLGNHDISIAADARTATTRTLCLNPMQTPDGSTFLLALWYADTWVIADGSWRIESRTLEKCLDHHI